MKLRSTPRSAEVLLAVAEAAGPSNTEGQAVMTALESIRDGRSGADRVLARLLELEAGGLVEVRRNGEMRFALTTAGERAVGRIGGGRVVETSLLMVDLVDFVAFTARHGDLEAHRASHSLVTTATQALRALEGRVVKVNGDGLIGAAPPTIDLTGAVEQIASRAERPDGQRWPIRASLHVGSPIEHNGDLYGRDVNLLARLCAAAAPGELVQTVARDMTGSDVEALNVRGLDEPVTIRRTVLL